MEDVDGRIEVPDPGLVVLAGPAGCGKSTFAARHFAPADIVSSDQARELVSGTADDQGATGDAFGLMRYLVDKRAKRRRFTVVDATNTTRRERARLMGVARRYDLPATLIAFDLPLELCQRRAAERDERRVPADIVERQHAAFARGLERLAEERFTAVHVLRRPQDVGAGEVVRIDTATRAMPDGRPRAHVSGLQAKPPLPPAVVVDLDGTLTSAAWREHHLAGPGRKDWPAFFAGMSRDAPVQPLVDLVNWTANHAAVVLLTGRPDDHEPAIRRWLADHEVAYDLLLMRRGGDRRPDTDVKRERYRQQIAPRYDVRLAVDDRPHVIEMWREEGLYVLTAVDPRLEPLT